MSLPTATNLQTLDYDYYGEPVGGSPTKNTIDLQTLDYDYYGEPFYQNNTTAAGGGGGGSVQTGIWIAMAQ
jgi:hypothetical protein